MTINRQQQKGIVEDLLNRIRDGIVRDINSGKVPDWWDGHELRELAADRVNRERTRTMQDKRRTRARNYRNDILNHNL